MLALIFLSTGCDEAPTSVGEPSGGAHHRTEPEDLSGSWRRGLSAEVPPPGASKDCPDADGDGFGDVWSCPGLSSDRADCDDSDPQVTPDTERWVTPGPFLMGSESQHAGRDEGPVHVVTVSGFCMDRFEMTNAVAGRPGPGRMPVQELSWEEAGALCQAQGKRLPTEAEWAKAARGGCEAFGDPERCDPEDLRPYPWGTEAPTCERTNHFDSVKEDFCHREAVEVGQHPTGAGPYGHEDLVGNVWEWTSDLYNPAIYSTSPRQDPAGPALGDLHGLRGGCYNSFSTNVRVANRFQPMMVNEATGVRCVRSRTTPAFDETRPPPDLPDEGGVRVDYSRPNVDLKLDTSVVQGTLTRADGQAIEGEILIAVFDGGATEGGPVLGHSPVAELELDGGGRTEIPYWVVVPEGEVTIEVNAIGVESAGRTTVNAKRDVSEADVAVAPRPAPPPAPGAHGGHGPGQPGKPPVAPGPPGPPR